MMEEEDNVAEMNNNSKRLILNVKNRSKKNSNVKRMTTLNLDIVEKK
jgi:hypothetical protein